MALTPIQDNHLAHLNNNSPTHKRKAESSSQEAGSKKQKTSTSTELPFSQPPLQQNNQQESSEILYFDLKSSSALTDEIFANALQNISSLQALCWFHGFNTVSDKSVYTLKGRLSQLSTLKLHSAGMFTTQGLQTLLSQTPQLRTLDLSFCKEVNDVWASVLTHCPYLEQLDLSWCENVSDHTVALIARDASNLRSLNFEGCQKCTDTALFALAQSQSGIVKSLESICLSQIPSISNQGINQLILKGENLKKLHLVKCQQLTSSLIPHLAQLSQLVVLNIADCGQIDHVGFEGLSRHCFLSLQELNLSRTSITNQTIQKITEIDLISTLQILKLNHCEHIDATALDFLPSLTRLTHLEIASNNLKRLFGVFEKIKQCVKLKVLNISDLMCAEDINFNHADVIPFIRSTVGSNLKEIRAIGLGKATDYQEVAQWNPNLKLILA